MKFLFLLILIFHISHVNADEIYNLIKIPNLEIYKLKNDNNIRYLSAKGNFKIGTNKNPSPRSIFWAVGFLTTLYLMIDLGVFLII